MRIRYFYLTAVLSLYFLIGCASAPKESIELSHMLGDDLESLHQSYQKLIVLYFDSIRQDVNKTIDQVYVPAYIKSFAIKGKLAEHARDTSDYVQVWAKIAVKNIEAERKKKLEPIDEEEKNLLASVNDAFDKAIRANAAITAHLISIQKVNDAQDAALGSLNLIGVRNKIDSTLTDASRKSNEISADVEQAGKKLDSAQQILK